MAFKNRIRLPFFLSRPQFPVERSVFRKADGSSKVLSAVVRNTYQGKTDALPEEWHRKLVIALNHDTVNIEDNRLLMDVVMDGDYGIEWQEFLSNPLAQSNFAIQVTPFNATNSNCQSCDEITQLELVDDTTATVFNEDTTYEYPVSVLDNDNICCLPFTVELVSYNTAYLSAAAISQAGIFTFTTKEIIPTINNLLLATYRVTCPNGGYDEANIYGNISGTSSECLPPGSVGSATFDLSNDTICTVPWVAASTAPSGGYDWYLYLESDIYTPVQSGNTLATSVNLTGLIPGAQYVFAVQSNCGGGDYSSFEMGKFTQPYYDGGNCGKFKVIHLPLVPVTPAFYLYMDCAGVIKDVTIYGPDEREICMMRDEYYNPVYFQTDSIYITVTYQSEC